MMMAVDVVKTPSAGVSRFSDHNRNHNRMGIHELENVRKVKPTRSRDRSRVTLPPKRLAGTAMNMMSWEYSKSRPENHRI